MLRSLPAERLSALRQYLEKRDGEVVSYVQLANEFDVSIQTVRRDVLGLEEAGLVRRTFGGAIVNALSTQIEPMIDSRRIAAHAEKTAIAGVAADFLENEATYFDASTTVMELIARIPDAWKGEATTSSLPAAYELARNTTGPITVLGGEYRRGSECVGGSATLAQITQMRFGTAFLSCRAFSPEHGLTEANESEAELKRVVIRNSRRVVLMADSTKADGISPFSFGDISSAHLFVTDEGLGADVRGRMASSTQLLIAARPRKRAKDSAGHVDGTRPPPTRR